MIPMASPRRPWLMAKTRLYSTKQSPLSPVSSSAAAATGQKPPVSPHIGFYKIFTRPVAKVLLMATLTYQIAYWAWVKLEKDEIKSQRQAEISALEAQLKDLTKSKDQMKSKA